MNAVALIEMIQPLGGAADDLEDNGDRAFFAVEIGDGERDAFARFVYAQDDELTRLRLFGDEGGAHFHQRDGGD